jgi:hypothetical protein
MSARAKSVIFWMGREHPNRKTSWPLRSQGNSEAHSFSLRVPGDKHPNAPLLFAFLKVNGMAI